MYNLSEWYPNIRDQARHCIWDGYNADTAARDAILLQTRDKQLQQKILAEDLNYANTVSMDYPWNKARRKWMRSLPAKVGQRTTG